MFDLMAVGEGSMPLYLHVVTRVLRDMRTAQQQIGALFSYTNFKRQMMTQDFTPAQLAPFQQRLDTLESFMPPHQTGEGFFASARGAAALSRKPTAKTKSGNDWKPKVCT
jgi:hypothetical protein